MMMIFLSLLGVSFTIAMVMMGPRASEKAIQKRVALISGLADGDADNEDSLISMGENRRDLSTQLGLFVERFRFAASLRVLLIHSGSTATVGSVVSTSLLASLAAAYIAHLFVAKLAVTLASFALGLSARYILLRMKKARRLNRFAVGLPDAIELMSRALRAGHSMASSIEIIAEQSTEPLASEFAILFQQQKFGIPFRDAILALGERVPSKDLHFLITAILVQKETGGDLTEILDRTTHVIRERVRITAEIRTYTAQGRLTGWILSALPVVLLGLINFASPGYSHELFDDPLGQKMLCVGAALIVLGGLIIRKIVDIKV